MKNTLKITDNLVGEYWRMANDGLSDGPYRNIVLDLFHKLVEERARTYYFDDNVPGPDDPTFEYLNEVGYIKKALEDFGINPGEFK